LLPGKILKEMGLAKHPGDLAPTVAQPSVRQSISFAKHLTVSDLRQYRERDRRETRRLAGHESLLGAVAAVRAYFTAPRHVFFFAKHEARAKRRLPLSEIVEFTEYRDHRV
jgi:hypothetical protein